jgi:hypothetical protein
MADVQWYYARNDEPFGPVSAAELKQLADAGQLKPDDLLWREGMDAWTTAINLRGLFGSDPPGDTGTVASSAVAPAGERAVARPRPPAAGHVSSHARLQSLVRTTQIMLWSMCVLVVLAGVVLFTRSFLGAKDPAQEAAAGAVFSTFFIGAYVLARAGEKLSKLLLGYARRRPR